MPTIELWCPAVQLNVASDSYSCPRCGKIDHLRADEMGTHKTNRGDPICPKCGGGMDFHQAAWQDEFTCRSCGHKYARSIGD